MKLFHELITEYASGQPLKTVVADCKGKMSYGELEALSVSCACALVTLGMKAGDAVAVYVPYIKEILLGAVSILRAGGIYIPFDDAHPVERMDAMLSDSEVVAILTVRELWNRKPLHFPEEKVIFLDELPEAEGGFKSPDELTEDSPAMLLYTSGTTGRPKGVLHTHEMLVHIVDWMNIHEDAEMNTDTRTGIMSGYSFVGTQMFLLGPPAKGGTVYIAPEAARQDVGYLYQFIKEADITHIFVPAGLAAILAEDCDIRGVFVFAAGEKLRNFKSFTSGNCLINSYGCTETSGVLSKKVFGNEDRILVGKPYINTQACIVNEAFETVVPGEPGELLISNSFMSRSYWKLPELSAQKWIMRNGTMWYRTGDRAICTPDGDYDILGRIDNMVKLRGFRIETGEVEAQTANATIRLGRSDVGQIVVTVKTVDGTDRLCCYYEAKEELDKKAITEEVAKYLTEYMVPDVWVRMDALPRNANGKVMRSELPQPVRERENRITGALDNEVLARLVYTAEEVLDTNAFIGPDDGFIELGGTSLTAMKFTTLLREQGIKVSSAQVLELNTLRKIADAAEVIYEQLCTREEYEEIREDYAARGEKIEKVLPITAGQDEMLFEQLINPDRGDFKKILFLDIDSAVSEKDLRESLDITTDENEAMRSSIVYRHVTAIQQVITDRKIPLEIIDGEGFGSSKMQELKERLLYSPMDLQRDSLIRVVYQRAPGINMLCFLTHSIAFDAVQRRTFLARLMGLLEEKYPDDKSVSGWREIMEKGLSEAVREGSKNDSREKKAGIVREVPPDICVYSENAGPKVVFVHTGNTGSEAYYRLAGRIGDRVSFAVIEPFNIYHMDKACYGIKNIAAKYIEILKHYQPEGPYILGGWCYGGIVAHEMACQLESLGESVAYLILLDSHAHSDERTKKIIRGMNRDVNRSYFETSPLFSELRESGMLEKMIVNAEHVREDILDHIPSVFHGNTLYFKPDTIPISVSSVSKRYWEKMMEYEAGNYEHFCLKEKLKIVHTPQEHDLMMDDPSLDIIVPELMKTVISGQDFGNHEAL